MEEVKEGDNESNEEKKNASSSEKKKILAIFNNFKLEYFIEYCFGVYRFRSIDGELRPPNWKMKAYGFFIFFLYSALFFWLLFFVPDTEAANSSEQSDLITTVDSIPFFVVLFQYAALIVSTNFFSSMNIRMITLLAEVDKTLQLEICTDFYKKMSSRLSKFLIFLTISHVINGLVDFITVTDRAWALTVFPLYFLQRFEVFVFCAYVIIVNGRLAVINNYLKEFNQEQDKKMVTVFTVKDTKIKTEKYFNYIGRPSIRNMKIRDLATTYDNIGEFCFMMNDVFNFQIFLTLYPTTYVTRYSYFKAKKIEASITMEAEKEDKKKSPGEKKKIADESEKQIVESINIIIFIEYIHGIFRFSLVNEKLRTPDWKMKAFTVFIITAFVVLFTTYFVLPTDITHYDNENYVQTADKVRVIILFIQYAVCTFTASFLVNSNNIRIITTLANLDKMLQVEKSSNFYSKSRWETYKYMVLVVISQLATSILDFVAIGDVAWAIAATPLNFIQKLEIITFCKYVDFLRRRLLMINSYLKTFVDEQDQETTTVFTIRSRTMETTEKFNFIGRASDSNTKIRDTAKMYDVIGQICTMVNEVFNFQILTILMSTFAFIIIIMWTSLYYYRSAISDLSLLMNVIVSSFFWICYVAIMSIACERLLLVRNETKILVNKVIMNYDLPKTMRVQAKAFMELVEAWTLRIYIYDMFSVDITLMLKFISVATTYLIVVIQIFNFF
ncbi:hypothetical protein HF086_004802 [Spodoptera exigua]|uniref:Gustatory receptor n=1 Tax=Spodoptera exigua TaxID=7107 RepID=A0A922M5F8_SPOEX|nr:hypothetical protein HF086_004802 [Spodoptera exigua]